MADVEFHVGSGDKQLQRLEPKLVDIDDVLRDVVVVLGVGCVRDSKEVEPRHQRIVQDQVVLQGTVLLVNSGVLVCLGKDGNAGVVRRMQDSLCDVDERVLRCLVLFKLVVVTFQKL